MTAKNKTQSVAERIEEIAGVVSHQVRETVDALAEAPRKAIGEIQADWTKRGRSLRKQAEKALRESRSTATKQRRAVEHRAERAFTDARRGVESLVQEVRGRVEKAVAPLSARLDVASRSDVESLRKRLDKVEKRVGELAATPAPPPIAIAKAS